MNSRELDRDIAGCVIAHRRLLETVGRLDDEAARRPSLLPGWTVGHVITHLARNADSHVRMLRGADAGLVLDQYAGGAAGREAEIEAGAHRPASELRGDLHNSIEVLESKWAATTDAGWAGSGRALRGEVANAQLPYRRWSETELHHVDLGLGYVMADVSNDLTGLMTRRLTAEWASRQPMGLATLPVIALRLDPHDRLAWLTGRLQVDGLAPADVFG
jgi:maleylpyruvate isomerase